MLLCTYVHDICLNTFKLYGGRTNYSEINTERKMILLANIFEIEKLLENIYSLDDCGLVQCNIHSVNNQGLESKNT